MKAFYSVYLIPCVLDIMGESVFELIYRKRDKCLHVCSCAAGLAAQLVKSQVCLHQAWRKTCTFLRFSLGSRTVTESEVNIYGRKCSVLPYRAAAIRLLVGPFLTFSHVWTCLDMFRRDKISPPLCFHPWDLESQLGLTSAEGVQEKCRRSRGSMEAWMEGWIILRLRFNIETSIPGWTEPLPLGYTHLTQM